MTLQPYSKIRYVINHERIHTAQQRELLFIPFYALYVLEWMVRLVQYRNLRDAYMNISFEREAYANGYDLFYLPRRKRYAWTGPRYMGPSKQWKLIVGNKSGRGRYGLSRSQVHCLCD